MFWLLGFPVNLARVYAFPVPPLPFEFDVNGRRPVLELSALNELNKAGDRDVLMGPFPPHTSTSMIPLPSNGSVFFALSDDSTKEEQRCTITNILRHGEVRGWGGLFASEVVMNYTCNEDRRSIYIPESKWGELFMRSLLSSLTVDSRGGIVQICSHQLKKEGNVLMRRLDR